MYHNQLHPVEIGWQLYAERVELQLATWNSWEDKFIRP